MSEGVVSRGPPVRTKGLARQGPALSGRPRSPISVGLPLRAGANGHSTAMRPHSPMAPHSPIGPHSPTGPHSPIGPHSPNGPHSPTPVDMGALSPVDEPMPPAPEEPTTRAPSAPGASAREDPPMDSLKGPGAEAKLQACKLPRAKRKHTVVFKVKGGGPNNIFRGTSCSIVLVSSPSGYI